MKLIRLFIVQTVRNIDIFYEKIKNNSNISKQTEIKL